MYYRICLLLLTLMMMGFVLDASTGSLDHRDAHNCWINCEQRGLEQGEYHQHLGPHNSDHKDGYHDENPDYPF